MVYLRDRELEEIDSYHIFLVVDKGCWRDADLTPLVEHTPLLEPLNVHVVTIDNLCDKTDLVYEMIGFDEISDEE